MRFDLLVNRLKCEKCNVFLVDYETGLEPYPGEMGSDVEPLSSSGGDSLEQLKAKLKFQLEYYFSRSVVIII